MGVWRRLARFAVQVRLGGMLQRLPGLLVSGLVILLAVLLRSLAVYMRRPVLYFGRLPVGFVHDTSYIRSDPEHAGYLCAGSGGSWLLDARAETLSFLIFGRILARGGVIW